MLDINGDMKTDLIYVSNEKHPKIKVALGRSNISEEFEITNFSDFIMSPKDYPNEGCHEPSADLISTPHSNSFLDLDGDCILDIFMQKVRPDKTTYHEIYVQKKEKGKQMYCLRHTNQTLVQNQGTEVPLVMFADMNRDAMPDMFFYFSSKIYVYYNRLNTTGL